MYFIQYNKTGDEYDWYIYETALPVLDKPTALKKLLELRHGYKTIKYRLLEAVTLED